MHPVPQPPRRNPFKAGGLLAKQFDAALAAYNTGSRDLIRDDGATRCMGNGWACAFWAGYDSRPVKWVVPGTLAHACYRAGQAQRIKDDARGVFVSPKTNSRVSAGGSK